jgi:hypothetical protein
MELDKLGRETHVRALVIMNIQVRPPGGWGKGKGKGGGGGVAPFISTWGLHDGPAVRCVFRMADPYPPATPRVLVSPARAHVAERFFQRRGCSHP